MGAFSDIQGGLDHPYDILVRRNIIRTFPLETIQKAKLEAKDVEKIGKIKRYLKVEAVHKIDSLQQATLSFQNTENYLAIFNKNENGGGWNDFIGIKGQIGRIKNYENKADTYISTASYVSKKTAYDENGKKLPRRTQTNIKDIVQLTQDLDYYKVDGMTEDQALQILANKIHQGVIEMPHFVIFSGKGLQLVWLIDNVMAKKGSGPEKLFKAVQSYLMKNLKELESDKVTLIPSNVIKLANTINSKNGEMVRAFVLRTDRVKLGYFKENYLPIPVPNKKVKVPRKPITEQKMVRDTRLWNLYSLNFQRAEDVFRVLDYKQREDEELIGIRHHLALVLRFHVLVYSNGDYDLAKAKVEEFWSRLEQRDATTYEEIERRSRTAERYYQEWIGEVEWQGKGKYAQPGLFYKNQTLVQAWELSKACQVQLKTIKIRDMEYERLKTEINRRKKGIKSHAEKKKEKYQQIKMALSTNPHINVRELEELTGIPKSTVSRLIKEMNEKTM